MKPHVHHIHSTLRVIIAAFAMICLLSLVATPFSSSAHAATTSSQKATQQAAGTVHGCPLGYVCIYPQNAGWNGDRPSNTYYRYGSYKLYNQYGNHFVLNNQTGNAWFWFCTDSYGKNCPVIQAAGPDNPYDIDLTPYNSVKLTTTL